MFLTDWHIFNKFYISYFPEKKQAVKKLINVKLIETRPTKNKSQIRCWKMEFPADYELEWCTLSNEKNILINSDNW